MASMDTAGLDADQVWDTERAFQHFHLLGKADTKRTAERHLHTLGILPAALEPARLADELGRPANAWVLNWALDKARRKRKLVLFIQLHTMPGNIASLHANDARGARYWVPLATQTGAQQSTQQSTHRSAPTSEQAPAPADTAAVMTALMRLQAHVGKEIAVFAHGALVGLLRDTESWPQVSLSPGVYPPVLRLQACRSDALAGHGTLGAHLKRLEAESVYLIREAVAAADKPVLLFSGDRDSTVLLHLARKAFYPAPPPLKLLHIDTRWQFQELMLFRDHMAQSSGMDLLVYTSAEAIAKNINPFDHGAVLHTEISNTHALTQALSQHQCDVVFSAARRDDAGSHSMAHRFSLRAAARHAPSVSERPGLLKLAEPQNKPGESLRVGPLSDWTELDIWHYLYASNIPVVSLYLAKKRPVVLRDGAWILVDDQRFRLLPGEEIIEKQVRFRALGCYPLTGAIASTAGTVPDIILEIIHARSAARLGRARRSDAAARLNKQKKERYF